MTSKLVVNNIEADVGISSVTFADNIQIVSGSQYLTITHQGIDFQNTGVGSSTTATSHLLDDYEEGTWTPTVEGGTTAGTYTYGNRTGRYTKIGRQVTATCSLGTVTASSAGTGNLLIRGLPFANNATQDHYGTAHISHTNVADTTVNLVARVIASATSIQTREIRDNTSITFVSVTDITSGSTFLHYQITYTVD